MTDLEKPSALFSNNVKKEWGNWALQRNLSAFLYCSPTFVDTKKNRRLL